MKLVIFGLTISSSWGNGHATLWRGLCRELIKLGHRVVFFEHDVPYYSSHRDLYELTGGDLILYTEWHSALHLIRRHLSDADIGIVTSYCPDGLSASEEILFSKVGLSCFYDLDTPITLGRLRRGDNIGYIGDRGLVDFDVVLSFTGGSALEELKQRLGARAVYPLYGSVDPSIHRPQACSTEYLSDLSYLGTYAENRQSVLESLFIEPARRLPNKKFLIGGAQYPESFPWNHNISFVYHVPPAKHPAFYSSSRITLNVTRKEMADMGYCPSGRLFEAAACGVPILSDSWEGIDQFFSPDSEIFIARSTDEVIGILNLPERDLLKKAQQARERVLAQHTSEKRAKELESILNSVYHFKRSELVVRN
jgi:spore maturation protein CgeB